MKNPFDKKYPNIARWVEEHEGVLELGYDVDSPIDSFVRRSDSNGTENNAGRIIRII